MMDICAFSIGLHVFLILIVYHSDGQNTRLFLDMGQHSRCIYMAGIKHMDNQEKRQPDNTYFFTTEGTTFEIEEYFSPSQTYLDIVKAAIDRVYDDV